MTQSLNPGLKPWASSFWRVYEDGLSERSIDGRRLRFSAAWIWAKQDVKRLVHPQLVVDATGVGSAVMEMIDRARRKAELTAGTITGGDRIHHRQLARQRSKKRPGAARLAARAADASVRRCADERAGELPRPLYESQWPDV